MVTIGNVRFEGKKSLKVRSSWFWWWEVVGLKVKVGGGGGQKSLGLVVGSVWVLKAFISQLHIWKAKGNKVSPAVTFNIKLSQGLISKRQGSKLPSSICSLRTGSNCTPVLGWGCRAVQSLRTEPPALTASAGPWLDQMSLNFCLESSIVWETILWSGWPNHSHQGRAFRSLLERTCRNVGNCFKAAPSPLLYKLF